MYHQKFSKETIWAVSIIILCILAASLQFFITKSKDTPITDFTYQDAASMVPAVSNETPVPVEYDCPIDFDALWETNKDVYAWITIPGTVIDYPILQHETDDSYYLNYTIDGVEGYPGCIYTERVNSKEFTDNNTVIYGHNMRNGTMFTDLHKFRDADFFPKMILFTYILPINY